MATAITRRNISKERDFFFRMNPNVKSTEKGRGGGISLSPFFFFFFERNAQLDISLVYENSCVAVQISFPE
jgi:hypothetical protein